MIDRNQILTLSPLKITGIYLLFGVIWIAATDWVIVTLIDTAETRAFLATIKRWGFVGISAPLIFVLTSVRQQRIDDSVAKLQTATEQLQVLYRVFRHNIRNNVTVIQGNIEIVQDHLQDSDHQAMLATACQTTERIATISEKLRVINESDLDPLPDEEIDLVALTDAEIDRFQNRYPTADVSTTMPERASIYGDLTLRYAIREILENAIEHNPNPPPQCEIVVEITRSYSQVELMVTDNGPGIPQDELTPLQTREETDLSHTTGVGLWLVTWLTQHSDGNIAFDTNPDRGATVTLQFQVGTQIPLYQSG